MCKYLGALLLAWTITSPGSSQTEAVAWWAFDEIEEGKTIEAISGKTDNVSGNYWLEQGVAGNCLKLDGYTTHVVRSGQQVPRLNDNFTIEAWVAPQTYPWNWTGIVDRETDKREGYFLGVSADGHIGLGVAGQNDGQWIKAISTEKIELLKWSHIAATCSASGEIVLYINGTKCGELSADDADWDYLGEIRRSGEPDLWIGRSHTKMYPKGTEREPSRQLLSIMVFDGLIDEVKIHDGAMDQKEIQRAIGMVQPENWQPLHYRRFPTEGADRREFGAYYTTLKYDETWDKLWRIGEYSDIVVTFEKPVRIVFWHGINYAASYVTENEIWMGDQSLESARDDYKSNKWGCAEHMSDKQCRYTHVRLIENNPARVIVHWRYNPCYITYGQANEDPETGWGDWTDEYFVIYPDAVTVRHQILWSSNFGVALNTAKWPGEDVPWHQFQETIMFNQPGTRPEDNVEYGALSVATMEGETYTCMWGEGVSWDEEEKIAELEIVKNATIQMTNLKSRYRPYIIFEPGVAIAPWVGEEFSFWNHWPVAQLPNDGREAPAPDRPSHTSFSCGAPVIHQGKGNSHVAVMLYGLTEEPIGDLVPLARSWNHPPELKVKEEEVIYNGYDKFQRAYILEKAREGAAITLQLEGSRERPIMNPALVLKGWGRKAVNLKINGVVVEEGEDYRTGYEKKPEGTDLVIWIEDRANHMQQYTIL